MNYSFDIDPQKVLGVTVDAPLEEIRRAYREQSKKYHPDHGGDEWAFRLVSKSYEILSRARVAARAVGEATRQEPRRPPVDAVVTPDHGDPSAGSFRSGIRDRVADPSALVDIELLLLRLELDDPYALITLPETERNLSCNLNVTWPSNEAPDEARAQAATVLPRLVEALDELARRTQPVSENRTIEDLAARAWFTYASARKVSEAFQVLRSGLKARGLGARQWTRELVIPRNGR